MNAKALKAQETMKAKLLAILAENSPSGIHASKLPKHLRRFLSVLEKEGKAKYFLGGWAVK